MSPASDVQPALTVTPLAWILEVGVIVGREKKNWGALRSKVYCPSQLALPHVGVLAWQNGGMSTGQQVEPKVLARL